MVIVSGPWPILAVPSILWVDGDIYILGFIALPLYCINELLSTTEENTSPMSETISLPVQIEWSLIVGKSGHGNVRSWWIRLTAKMILQIIQFTALHCGECKFFNVEQWLWLSIILILVFQWSLQNSYWSLRRSWRYDIVEEEQQFQKIIKIIYLLLNRQKDVSKVYYYTCRICFDVLLAEDSKVIDKILFYFPWIEFRSRGKPLCLQQVSLMFVPAVNEYELYL